MNSKKSYLLALLASILLAGCATLRQSSGQAGLPQSGVGSEASMVASAPSGGPQEGIKVHGHWTIEVKEPDGTLVTRREFENALFPSNGDNLLANVLARNNTVGLWRVDLEGATPPCPIICWIKEGTGLLVGVPAPAAGVYTLQLSGNITAQQSGSVDRVNTQVTYCPPSVAPADCNDSTRSGSVFFTYKFFITPVPVSAGQQIQVTVAISFS